jgi:glycosyltransferase involved in cell wall biosynthesis
MLAYSFKLFSFTKRNAIEKKEEPSIIYASSPHPLALIAGIKVAKKYNVPCIVEIRDLWPETIFAFGKAKENSLVGKLLINGEHWIYKNADSIVFLKEGDTDYLKEKKWLISQGGDIDINKCYYINNGVDIESFNKQVSEETFNDVDLNDDKFKVMYAGAIRPINNVGSILDSAKMLLDKERIQFLIYGDGNQREMLIERVKDENITNVKIKGYVDKKYMPYVLSKSAINILSYSQSKYNWSRGNSSNKLFEYMASGKPIISTVKMGYSPIEKYDCGVSLENDTPEALAEAVLNIYNMSSDRYTEISENAKKGAKDFDYKKLTKDLVAVMESQLL